eukprot:gene22271-28385_t
MVKDLVNEVMFHTRPETSTSLDVMMATVVNKGNVFKSDFKGIITELAQFATAGEQTIAAFTSAIVKGVEFRGRGQLFTENSQGNHPRQKRLFVTQNASNNLSSEWHKTYQINSWAKVEDWFIAHPENMEKKHLKSRMLFGQSNYFFRLHVPSDPLIDKLALANMVLRTASAPDRNRGSHRFIDMNSPNTSFFHAKQFIVLNYFEATNVALSPLDINNYPITNPQSGIKESINQLKKLNSLLSHFFGCRRNIQKVNTIFTQLEEIIVPLGMLASFACI